MNDYFSKGYVQLLMTVVLVAGILSLLSYANLANKEAEGVYTGETTISVSGEGEVLAKPDIGQFSFSVRAEGEDAVEAQEKSAEAINKILSHLEESGVEEKDIKTQNYNLNPKYRYEERICARGTYCPPGEPIIDGYEVYQNISVKVRDLDAAGGLISGVGERGATNISGLNFTIDDESVLEAQARAEAIADAKEKAEVLARDLGMKLHRIVGFNENRGGGYGYSTMDSRAFGGDAMEEVSFKTSPSLPTGENTITSSVSITYELK